MSCRIEDYALIGDTLSAALVGRDGSIDWLCVPRFDSPACFAALLGTPQHGRWLLAPDAHIQRTTRRYHEDTLVLETVHETAEGTVAVIDWMPLADGRTDVVRIVEGRAGRVPMRMELIIRFEYGSIVPWVRRLDHQGLGVIAGPDALEFRTPVETHGEAFTTQARFTVGMGERVPFALTWYPSHEDPPEPIDPEGALTATERGWRDWVGQCTYTGRWREPMMRSLLTLKALTYEPTGGIVAAPTASLPEWIGGGRNWDYRFCWLRDATLTLYALLGAGYHEEAAAWRGWLQRAVAGRPADLQILYGLRGDRRMQERELGWLPGYEDSRPVRVGNAAMDQRQLDVYGEVMDALHLARVAGVEPDLSAWGVQRAVLDFLESHWQEPDRGIWEVRGPPRQFTHSKMMAWLAFDRGVKAVERFGLEGPVDRWRDIRDEIHTQVCREGFDAERGTFVQSYGSHEVDASLLLGPLIGFLAADDPRVAGTVEAIQADLAIDGLVRRYRADQAVDGLEGPEGVFLACSFWLVDNLALLGRQDEAEKLFEHLLSLQNDVGLLAEQYDPAGERMLGNFPQAFSHVALINTIRNLTARDGPARERAKR